MGMDVPAIECQVLEETDRENPPSLILCDSGTLFFSGGLGIATRIIFLNDILAGGISEEAIWIG